MGIVSHLWPGITPFNVTELPAYWWAYYVRLAMAHDKRVGEVNRSRGR